MNKLAVLLTISIIALAAYSAEQISLQQTVYKFLYAMCGVVIYSIAIYWGLILYSRYVPKKVPFKFDKENSLSTPQTTDEAITFFIKKNKLR